MASIEVFSTSQQLDFVSLAELAMVGMLIGSSQGPCCGELCTPVCPDLCQSHAMPCQELATMKEELR